ncbi:hypothetical protein IFM89_006314 [Coptis chinensis]|uniref:C3H1-type domain-containing protein n=1 Tax=Coptis chinensis TaxID=261450 RepID=A0A835ICA1_9MAGN|nr:hypothetical protein IFM89_006314 [Coptis chinensis]
MDDELTKRNTDCVYFLASPLTCKKGAECEYRHSEIARLNPRDCWYWLAGNCLNPTCAFRHPPLEGRSETTLEPESLPAQASAPVIKSNVPCYFYFSSFCNKGENCSFLHGSNINSGQSSKSASLVANVHPLENKVVTSINGVTAAIELPHDESQLLTKVVECIQSHSKVECQPSVYNNGLHKSPSPRTAVPGCDDLTLKSEFLLPAEGIQSPVPANQSPLCAEHNSDGQFDDHIDPEERWESSPGFDVLVDDGSENLGYEDDPEYLLAQKRESRVLHEQLLQYDYEDSVGYDPLEFGDSGILYEHEMYESYDPLENDNIADQVQRVPKRSREMMLDPMGLPNRQNFPREVDLSVRNGVDLRNQLRKRRRTMSRPKRGSLSHLKEAGQERPGRRHKRQTVHGRLTSEVASNRIGGCNESDHRSYGSHHRGLSRQTESRYSKTRQQERERRRQSRPQPRFSENSRGGTASQNARSPKESITTFTGPKTLAEIKEEKRKTSEIRVSNGSTTNNGRTASQNFEGPKPLREILKDKRRLGSMSDDTTSSRSRHDQYEPEMNHINFDVDNDDLLDSEYEDDDGLQKKLSSIMS